MMFDLKNQWHDKSEGFIWLGFAAWSCECPCEQKRRMFHLGLGIVGFSLDITFHYGKQ